MTITIPIPDNLLAALGAAMVLYATFAAGWFLREAAARPEKVKCPTCSGDGERGVTVNLGPAACPTCRATGTVWRFHTPMRPPADWSADAPHWPKSAS